MTVTGAMSCGSDHARQRVDQVEIVHQDEMIDDQSLDRNHEARQDHPPEDAASGEIQLRDRVAGAGGHHHDDHGHGPRGDQRVDVPQADLGLHQDMDVVFDREVLRPEVDDWLHDQIFRLERRHEPPIERKRPQHGAEQREHGDEKPDEIQMSQAPQPSGASGGDDFVAGVDGRGHLSPRARSSWNCSTDNTTMSRNRINAAASAKPPWFCWNASL